ncbi:sigma-70 family RNA polymerase sigma factor [Nocardia farcinica]|uniref:sigma-70 family RNA polymerase sigma factor n=1 Tax=Nocardia farcinica TaxID=37329 RepID=UPI001B3C5159|nr:sigma-70 family RNA polymerase sigma factor [Nocardia farcinica]MBF6541261.1 sigma-70 family RNA polymerase sigma factor [Nocardia farcinica]
MPDECEPENNTVAVATRAPGRPLGEGPDLAALLSQIAAGDREAFTQFYRATNVRVFRTALRVLRGHAAAEETTQEVFLQVWSIADRYDRRLCSPVGWLMMLTHRRAVDRVRAEAAAGIRESTYGATSSSAAYDVVAEAAVQRLERLEVARYLRGLSAVQREAIALAYYGGRTYREVAAHLDVPLPTVKTRIRSGLQQLEASLRAAAN